jgi:V/A-type H+-transporting ATPase subunit F
MKYYIIGDEDAVIGFGMVGVQGRAVKDKGEAEAAFRHALDDREIGIIIITERITQLIKATVDRYLFRERFPLIVEIPDRKGPVPGRIGIREMVNAAIGISL